MGILIPLADRAWVIPGGVNIGVLANDDEQVVLVDTGLNESSAKKAIKVVREELGGDIVAVLTTHAHADHFGGNATVVKRTGAVVHAPKFDEAFLRYPLLQPASLFGGADPLDTLRGNFLLADPSPVDVIVEPGAHEIAGIASRPCRSSATRRDSSATSSVTSSFARTSSCRRTSSTSTASPISSR